MTSHVSMFDAIDHTELAHVAGGFDLAAGDHTARLRSRGSQAVAAHGTYAECGLRSPAFAGFIALPREPGMAGAALRFIEPCRSDSIRSSPPPMS
jgi:hypothetical protein